MRRFARPLLLTYWTLAMGSCSSAIQNSGSVFSPYRHPLLTRERPVQRANSPAPSKSTSKQSPTGRCITSFRHSLLNRCETWPAVRSVERQPPPLPNFSDPVKSQLALAVRARSMLKDPGFPVNGHSYRKDCSGLVMAIYAAEGVLLDKLIHDPKPGESMVAAIYRGARERGLVHKNKVPSIGDLVFFDNTFDRNKDGRANDLLTHIGIVESVAPNGTISIIHRSRQGILRYKMNLFRPNTRKDSKTNKVLNHYLRVGSPADTRHTRKLTGELFHAFASLVH